MIWNETQIALSGSIALNRTIPVKSLELSQVPVLVLTHHLIINNTMQFLFSHLA